MPYVGKWDRIFKNFKECFPSLVETVVDWYPNSRDEVTIVDSNGKRMIFNNSTQSVRFLGSTYGNPLNVDEADWCYEFARIFKKAIRTRLITQAELCERVGITQPTLRAYMNGRSIPNIYILVKIANVLECAIDEFLDFRD